MKGCQKVGWRVQNISKNSKHLIYKFLLLTSFNKRITQVDLIYVRKKLLMKVLVFLEMSEIIIYECGCSVRFHILFII